MNILLPGQIINQTYEVEKFIGEGAFAEVYRVRHRFLGRQAMKIYKTPGMKFEEIESSLTEAVLLSKIDHPNIVRIFDANVLSHENNQYGFYTMEYLPAGSLEKLWFSYGSNLMPVTDVVNIITQICKGIAVGHSESPPIIHRDIKPQNVLINYTNGNIQAKVSDFGLAKKVNPLTLMASAHGTMAFKAPETQQNPSHDSCAGDVWAIGITMFILLTDLMPFKNIEKNQWLFQAPRYNNRRYAKTINLNVDEQLDEILNGALVIDPKERYPNAMKFWKNLRNGSNQRRVYKTILR